MGKQWLDMRFRERCAESVSSGCKWKGGVLKRFTETNKWEDGWYRKLPLEAKLLWQWLCDHCDQAGVIEPDLELASFQIGLAVTSETMGHFSERINPIGSKKIHIAKFVQFQYGKLSRLCKPHMPVFAALERHGIDPDGVPQNETFKNTVDDYVKAKVISRDGCFCAYLGMEIPESEVVVDHIHPRSKGGTQAMDNLVVASAKMNALKSDIHVHRFCIARSLDVSAVFERLSKATGKPIESFRDSSIGYHGSLKEKEEEKEKDQEEEKEKVSKSRCTVEELRAFMVEIGLPESDGEYLHAHLDECGWMRGKSPIKNWKSAARKWKAGEWLPSQKLAKQSQQSFAGMKEGIPLV